MRAAAVILSLVLLSSCDTRKEHPATNAPNSTVLVEYRDLYTQIGEDVAMEMAHVYPHKVGLEIDDAAGPNARQQLSQDLKRLQPQIDRILELSTKDAGPLPQEIESAGADGWPRAWLNRCSEIVQADAGRLWDEDRPEDAAKRVTALIRIGSAMMKDSGELTQMWGLARAGSGAMRANGMIDAGLLGKLTSTSKDALLNAAVAVRVTDEHLKRFDKLAPQTRDAIDRLTMRLHDR
jgi:hypothetical protein